MLFSKSTFLALLPAASVVAATNNFNYEVIESKRGTTQVDNPASFTVEWRNLWTKERHPFRYPEGRNPHWSSIVLAAHSESYSMWCEGCIASDGVEKIAELGSTSTLRNELNKEVENNSVLDFFSSSGPQGYVDNSVVLSQDICVGKNYPYISAISMIAPSPDWFTGAYNIDLTNDGVWYDELSVSIFAWDAGTEDGDDFTFNNPDTSPREGMSPFTANGSSELFVSKDDSGTSQVLPVGTLTFKRVDAGDLCTEKSEQSNPDTFTIKFRRKRIEVTCAWAKARPDRCNRRTRNANGSKAVKVARYCPITCGN